MMERGRHIGTNLRKSLTVFCTFLSVLQVLITVSSVMFASQVYCLTGLQLIWLMWIMVPVLCIGLLFSPPDSDIMQQLPEKDDQVWSDATDRLLFLSVRTILVSGMGLGLYCWSFLTVWENSDRSRWMFRGIETVDDDDAQKAFDTAYDMEFHAASVISQNVLLFALVLWMGVLTISQAYGRDSILVWKSSKQPLAVAVFVTFCILTQMIYFACALAYSDVYEYLSRISSGVFVLTFCFPAILVGIDEYMKRFERRRFSLLQTEIRIFFETKLGKHSPRMALG